MTLDTGSLPTGARVQQHMPGQIRRQNPSRLPCYGKSLLPSLLPTLSHFWSVVFSRWFQLAWSWTFLCIFSNKDSRVSPPKFLSLLVAMPIYALHGSFNKVPLPAHDNILKISSIPIIHFGCQHIFKLAIQLKDVLSLN